MFCHVQGRTQAGRTRARCKNIELILAALIRELLDRYAAQYR